MISAAPNYRLNLEQQAERIFQIFGREYPGFSSLAKEIDLQDFITTVLNGVTGLAKNFFLVILYVLFLLIEQGAFPRKLLALRLSEEQRSRLLFTLSHINTAMRKYLGVKTFTSLITAILSFLILEGVLLDFALFWAFIIFLFNFIPTVGSITATALPALLALVQFEELTPFFVIIFAVTGVQLLIGNVLEPRLMGNSLNISPFVVILSLILWSILWGVVGMLLCVPITVAIIIICAQFPATRPVAVLLSRNGQVIETFTLKPRKPKPAPQPIA
jgi:predicted PurR-regulated permease PerM